MRYLFCQLVPFVSLLTIPSIALSQTNTNTLAIPFQGPIIQQSFQQQLQHLTQERTATALNAMRQAAKVIAGTLDNVLTYETTPIIDAPDLDSRQTAYFEMRQADNKIYYSLSHTPAAVGILNLVLSGQVNKDGLYDHLQKSVASSKFKNILSLHDVEKSLFAQGEQKVIIDESSLRTTPTNNGNTLVHLKYYLDLERFDTQVLSNTSSSLNLSALATKVETPAVQDHKLSVHRPEKFIHGFADSVEGPDVQIGLNGATGRIGINIARIIFEKHFRGTNKLRLTAIADKMYPNDPQKQRERFALWFFDEILGPVVEGAQNDVMYVSPEENKRITIDTDTNNPDSDALLLNKQQLIQQFKLQMTDSSNGLFIVKSQDNSHIVFYVESWPDDSHFIIRDQNHRIIMDTVVVNRQKEPKDIQWPGNLDVVIDATGAFLQKEQLQGHLSHGAKLVVLTAPGKGEEWASTTYVHGVNSSALNTALEKDPILSTASCTTNGLAPVIDILNQTLGVEAAVMTTIHSATNSQTLLPKGGSKSGSAYGVNAASTGAAKAIHLLGLTRNEKTLNIDGDALRVPTPNGSSINLTIITDTPTSTEQLITIFEQASLTTHKNLLNVDHTTNSSKNIIGQIGAQTIWAPSIKVVPFKDDKEEIKYLVTLQIMYDNEGQYSRQVLKTVLQAASQGYKPVDLTVQTQVLGQSA